MFIWNLGSPLFQRKNPRVWFFPSRIPTKPGQRLLNHAANPPQMIQMPGLWYLVSNFKKNIKIRCYLTSYHSESLKLHRFWSSF